jgi:prepilin-type N-terminal cleavage/methylation domain-containing protein
MPLTRRPAFTLVEVIVALTLLAVGAAGLASALTADKQLRDAAQARTRMAAQLRARLGTIAATRCMGDTNGVVRDWWGDERWRATTSGDRAHLVDSLIPLRPRLAVRPVTIETEIACLP